MKFKVEAVKAGGISAFDGGPLVAQVLLQGFEMVAAEVAGNGADGFHFNGPAEEHVLPGIGNLDQADRRSALGNHINQCLLLEPGEGIVDGGARNPEAFGKDLLVETLAGLELEGDDRFAQDEIDVIARASPGALSWRGGHVQTGRCIIHTNMLV